ncbi:MAG: hypothetical protein H7144_01360 [Burkholderiales bacterium]|nr:hypothetical protein [Phycisphaerae bacterium]
MHRRGISKIYLYPAIFMIAVVVLAVVRIVTLNYGPAGKLATTQPSTKPATQPATAPATTRAATQPAPMADLLDVVRADYPDYPTTQPLDLPAELADAARIILDRPVYLDVAGKLWITHEAGKPVDELLTKPLRRSTLIVQEEVLYVHYSDENNTPTVVARSALGRSNEIVTRNPHPMNAIALHQPRFTPQLVDIAGADWDRATRFGSKIILPHASGYFEVETNFKLDREHKNQPSPVLKFTADDHNPPVVLTTPTMLLCWSPWENGKPGSVGAVIVKDQRTITLDASTGWFDQVIQLVPLADGSILAVGRTENGIDLKLSPIDAPATRSPEQAEQVRALAQKLADRDPVVREKTQRELEALGPSIHTDLETMRESLPAEAQVRIGSLLGQRFAPTLAGLRPLEGEVHVASRFTDGGCALLLSGGGVYQEGTEDKTLIPAWVSIRPGQYIERLPDALTANFVVGKYQLQAVNGEWLLIDPVLGARRWIGARLQTMLTKELRHFDRLVGIDANNRWIFRSIKQPGKTLVLDASLPDLTPKLPVWEIDAPDGAGWTSTDWPALLRDKRTFVLDTHGWRMLAADKEKLLTVAPNVLPTVATDPADSAGNRLELINGMVRGKFGGRDIAKSLPPEAAGAHSIFITKQHLFLVADGAVYRALVSADDTSPILKLDGTFTKGIPAGARRVWQDPAGRLVFAGANTLWVAFPVGRVPGDLAKLMLKPPLEEEEK